MHRKRNQFGLHLFLAVTMFIQAVPLVIVFFNSFRKDREIKDSPVGFPTISNFENYIKAWDIGGYNQAYINSIVVSLTTTAMVVIMALLMGFFLAKSNVKIKGALIAYFGVAMSIPMMSFIAPLYYRFANAGLVNSILGIIFIYIATNLPFNVLLARTYIMGIPNELCEAATIDGCGTMRIFSNIIVPLSKPVVTTIALISFVSTWNEFTIANTFLQEAIKKTVSTKYVLFVTERGSEMDMIFTAAVISMLPIIIVFIALQSYFVDGMTSGSVKG